MSAALKYLGLYWQGRAPLGVVVVALVAVGATAGYVVDALGPDRLVLRLVALALIVGFLLTGSLRTVTRLLQSGTGPQAVWAIYGAIAILLYLTALRVLGFFLLESNITEPLDTRPPKVVVLEGRAEITGEIDYRTYTELGEILEAYPNITTVRLSSTGGIVAAGRALGLLIERRGLNTFVADYCYSACTLAFSGGNQRELIEGGVLGFHGYQFDHDNRVRTVNVEKVVAKDQAFLERRGFDREFLERVYQVGSKDIWIPTRAELLEAGVITR